MRAGMDSDAVFAIDDAGTVAILHSFGGFPKGDGSFPVGLIQARDGRLYGTTRLVGHPAGTVYSIDLAGNYRVLHSFVAFTAPPGSRLLEASDGNLYGVTRSLPRCSGSIRAGP